MPSRPSPADTRCRPGCCRRRDELLGYGLGITNLVARGSARADELIRDELVAGGAALTAKIDEYRPRRLAALGVGAYRTAFGERAAAVGPQEQRLAGTPVWVLPNPSGLNARFQLADLAAEFARLRQAVEDPP